MPINGLVTMTPTSVAKTGTGSTATINTNGSVTFSTCATLSLNGVFTSSYDNYMISMRCVQSSGGSDLTARMRSSGTDNSTSNSYVSQFLISSGTVNTGGRLTNTYFYCGSIGSTQRDGISMYLFGPKLSAPTAVRSNLVSSNSSAWLEANCGTHNQSTSYDGITLIIASPATFTGLVAVYGFNQ